MKTLRKMDSTGDSRFTFDESQANAKATQEARALFDRMQAGGGAVFALDGKGEGTAKVTRFEDLAEDNIAVPKIAGG